MIYLYTGTPGSGKSLHSASDIDLYVRKKRNVISNYPVNMNFWSKRQLKKAGEIINVTDEELTVPFLFEFAQKYHKKNKKGQMKEKQTLLVIDECQNKFNCRNWNAKDRPQWAEFFRQHRKLGYTCILITQDISFMDKQIRAVIEKEYHHRNLKNFKLIGGVLSLLLGGNLFCVPVTWMSNGKHDHTEWFRGKRKYYKLYDSYMLFNRDALKGSDTAAR
jgi:zona occludens toxin (predicted ATPase)